MRPQVRAFRDAAAQACQLRRFSFKEFMEDRGLEDILNAAETNNASPKEIAGEVLFRCCLQDGRFNNFHVGVLAVMSFLNHHLGPLGQGGPQAFHDLATILKGPCTAKAIAGWLDTHYP